MKSPASPILCRPAGRGDTQQAMSLVKGIWGGDDYVPEVWDAWLADTTGLLAVAVWRGRVAGFGHLSDLGSGEAWLEGLRVAPELQRHGIGSSLHAYFVSRWLAGGSTVIRLLTHERRDAVKAMCARTGFESIARVQFRSGSAAQGKHAFEQVPNDDPRAIGELLQAGTPALSEGLLDLGWELAKPTLDRLRSTQGIRVWAWRDGQGWLITRQDATNPDPEITLSAAVGAQLPVLLSDVRFLAQQLGVEHVHWLAPDSESIQQALDEAGFDVRDESEIFLVYERRR